MRIRRRPCLGSDEGGLRASSRTENLEFQRARPSQIINLRGGPRSRGTSPENQTRRFCVCRVLVMKTGRADSSRSDLRGGPDGRVSLSEVDPGLWPLLSGPRVRIGPKLAHMLAPCEIDWELFLQARKWNVCSHRVRRKGRLRRLCLRCPAGGVRNGPGRRRRRRPGVSPSGPMCFAVCRKPHEPRKDVHQWVDTRTC